MIKKKYCLPKQFVLYVGDVNSNKNLLSLGQACEKLKTTLVIVGKQATVENFDRRHPENITWARFLDRYADNPLII